MQKLESKWRKPGKTVQKLESNWKTMCGEKLEPPHTRKKSENLKRRSRNGAKVCKSCRSRQEFSNKYLLAKIGVDTAENGPLNVCQKLTKRFKAKKMLEKT